MGRAIGLLALLLALAPACKEKDKTKIVVAVWSDLAVPDELDAVRIDVRGASATSDSFGLTSGNETGKSRLPVQLQLVPLAAKNETFTVTAVGLLAGSPVVAQSARVSFASGQALLLALFLGQACAGVTCPDASFTCATGTCNQPVVVGPLPPYDPSNLTRPDAGAGLDGGGIDGGATEDAPSRQDASATCRFGESEFGLCTFGP